jgi:type IV pilus assembly protein PilE
VNRTKIYGFTLIELLIVMAIIGIILSVAYPSYQNSMTKTRRSDGQAALLEAMNAEERYFTENNTYSTTLADVNASSTSEKGHYTISAAACGGGIDQCVILTATPQGVQSSDGALTLNSLGVKLPADKW